MGRLLIRMACSSDLGLGSNLVATVTLIMATTTRRCSSCTPNYLMISLVLETTTLLTMASRLIQPKSCSTDESVFLQVGLHLPLWHCEYTLVCIVIYMFINLIHHSDDDTSPWPLEQSCKTPKSVIFFFILATRSKQSCGAIIRRLLYCIDKLQSLPATFRV